MVSAGLIVSRRGKKGGFFLAVPPSEIRVLDILRAVEGPVVPAPCTERAWACREAGDCVTMEVWVQVRDTLNTVLAGITLAELVKRHEECKVPRSGRIIYKKIG
jgi:Rrf2 family transcriptional regulator, cysteine metabolism repressor